MPAGTVSRAKATCLCCGKTLRPDRVRAQLAAQRGGADVIFQSSRDRQGAASPTPLADARGSNAPHRTGGARLLAVVTLKPGETDRHYRLPTERDYEAVRKAQARLAKILDDWQRGGKQGLCPVPDEPLPPVGTLGFRVQRYGMLQWGDLFTARQKVALVTLARLARERPDADGEAVRAAMAVLVNRCADYNSANCRWVSHGEFIGNTFTRQALPIVWDFVEIDPSAGATGGALGAIEWVANVVQSWPSSNAAQVQQGDATHHPLPNETAQVWFTDPPYYDAVPYADLADFFLVWLKEISAGGLSPHLSPKDC